MRESGAKHHLQGTILTDVDETVAGIKRQHNVFEQLGIDPQEAFGYKIIEPLIQLRKDGVRRVGKALGLPVELFDRIPFPNSGNRHLVQLQLAGKYIGGDEEFTRFYASFETYFPLGRYLNYHPHLAIGISRSGLPPSEQFFLGGLHSFAGFRTHQLAGDKMFIFSNEVRVKLPLMFYLSGRHDMGEVYVSSDQIKLRNLRHGVGISLALDSPIGPCELGYGIVNTDLDRFYVNVGFRF